MSRPGSVQGARSASRPARRGPAPRRRGMVAGVGAGLVVLVLVVVLAFVGLGSGGSHPASSLAPADVVSAVTHVPVSALDSAGIGTTVGSSGVRPPEKTSTSTVLQSGGKPLVTYMGADYCPYCAAERWPLVVALSRFGTFHNLGATTSSSTDVFPNTPTFSFYKSGYSSPYIVFQGVEQATRTGRPLQKATPAQQALYNAYERPPYLQSASQAGIPFVDFANRFIVVGVTLPPQALRTPGGTPLPMGTIAGSLSDPATAPAKAVDASANYMTAAICVATHGRPSSVCKASGVVEASRVLSLEPVGLGAAASTGAKSSTPAAG